MADEVTNPRNAEEQRVFELATQMGLNYFNMTAATLNDKALSLFPPQIVEQLGFVPLQLNEGHLEVGVTIDTDEAKFELIRRSLKNYDVHFSIISEGGLRSGLDRIRSMNPSSPNTADRSLASDFRQLETELTTVNPKDLFTIIVQAAATAEASDAHIEPGQDGARIRFRMDGVLHSVAHMATDRYESFLADLQIRSGMKWGLGEAQGGRIRVPIVEKGIKRGLDIRIETVPSIHGEDIVLRLFHIEAKYLELDKLGMHPRVFPMVEEILVKPHGMVLTVGPTGSGKTSTLYALLNRLNSDERKLVTLEDPVEYELPGVTQIPVNTAEDSFAKMLRSVLREDPDIVMIGEIRDTDTGKTALQAALTGHLMLSSFHAIDTAAAITRLLDLTGEAVLVTSALRIIIAQRLVRRICPDCKVSYEPSPKIKAVVEHALEALPEEVSRPEVRLFRGQGCDSCHHFGYQGRVGLFEALPIFPELKDAIMNNEPADKLREKSLAHGLMTLEQDGVLKALEGLTTIEEVFRVVGEGID
jgi:type II secretory ATPase GspE/PulE/Tfp pilus assembly ATPase PilB-like protein